LFSEVSDLLYTGKRSLADLSHALLCTFAYGVGCIFGIGQIPLMCLQLMEISTCWYNAYLLARKEMRRTPVVNHGSEHELHKVMLICGCLFAASFFVVRIVLYGFWFAHVLPRFYANAHAAVCGQDILEGKTWCLRINAIAVVLLTAYYVLNCYWVVCILNKMINGVNVKQTKAKEH